MMMRVLVRQVLAPMLLLFTAVSPLPAQPVSPALGPVEFDPWRAPLALHPPARLSPIPMAPTLTPCDWGALSHAHVVVKWSPDIRIATGLCLSPYAWHHGYGIVWHGVSGFDPWRLEQERSARSRSVVTPHPLQRQEAERSDDGPGLQQRRVIRTGTERRRERQGDVPE